MIFTIIIIGIVGVVTFFHYIQGFFSATLSMVITIIAAVLAVSYHESVAESVLNGKAAGVAHAMSLAVLFGVIYLVLRVLFDKMVPGNVRFPSLVDKAGAGAVGIVAGVFAAGVVALVAQYMPFMPSIAGYSRYATIDTREVTLPALGNGRQNTSEMWDELKSPRPGQFDPVDKGGIMVPADDILLSTVAHLSDGGSLAGRQRLVDVHPDLPQELFAQRLGMQTGGGRVIPKNGVQSVDIFQAPSLQFRDHEFKKIRTLETKGLPISGSVLKPTPKQILLIVRVTFTRYAGDNDHWVRLSPGSARLVARSGAGREGDFADYYPIGTVEQAKTLYLSKPDDYLLVKDDAGVDLAYLIDRTVLLSGGGQGSAAKIALGTFFELKRMSRTDLGGKSIPAAYKADAVVKVERKQTPADEVPPEAPAAPAPAAAAPAAAAGDVEALKTRLAGNWAGGNEASQLLIDFNADGTLKFTSTPKGKIPNVSQGTWEALRAPGENILVIKRTIGASAPEATVTFTGDDDIALTSTTAPTPIPLKRRS